MKPLSPDYSLTQSTRPFPFNFTFTVLLSGLSKPLSVALHPRWAVGSTTITTWASQSGKEIFFRRMKKRFPHQVKFILSDCLSYLWTYFGPLWVSHTMRVMRMFFITCKWVFMFLTAATFRCVLREWSIAMQVMTETDEISFICYGVNIMTNA